MKKRIMMIAAALIGVLGITASAQAPQCPKGKACCDSVNCQASDLNKMRQPREFTEFAFEGILLEPAQQIRMDSLNAAVKAQQPATPGNGAPCKKKNCQNCPNCQQGQTCQNCPNCQQGQTCQQSESAACPAQASGNCPNNNGKKGRGRGQRNGMRGSAQCPYGPDYIAKVKEILTPEQYTMFLENIVTMAPCPNGPQGPGQAPNTCPNKCTKSAE